MEDIKNQMKILQLKTSVTVFLKISLEQMDSILELRKQIE